MTTHLTAETIDRMRRNELAGAEMFDALAHVEGCEVCAAHARVRLGPEIDALVDDLAGGADAAGSAGGDTGAPRWWIAAAAVILIAIVAIAFLRAPKNAPQEPKPVIAQPTQTTPVPQKTPAPRYANAEWESLVATATRTNALPYPRDLAALESHEIVLRGGTSATPTRLTPSGVVIDDTRPAFTWPAHEGATYTVAIFENEKEMLRSPSLRVARWTPSQPLRRGATYTWQVAIRKGDATEFIPAPPAPIAMFRIVSEEQHRELEEAQRQHPNDAALHAVLRARAGMRAAAEEAWERRER
jgi:hypothetical protein